MASELPAEKMPMMLLSAKTNGQLGSIMLDPQHGGSLGSLGKV
jgi:hypothetical protein